MKKTAKNLTALIFCLALIFSMAVPVFAIGKVGSLKVKSTATTSVTLTWKKVSGITGYEIQTQSGNKWKKVATTNKTTYTHSKLKAGTIYKYRVRAIKAGLRTTNGAFSSTVTAITPLPKVGSFKTASTSTTTAKLQWAKVSDAKGYQVQKYDAKKKKWVAVKTLSGTSLNVSGLAYGSTTKFRVRAYKTSGKTNIYGAYSATLSVFIPYAKPASLKLSKIENNAATLTWSKVSGMNGYQVQKYDAKNKKWVNVKSLNATSLKVTGLPYGATTQFRVRGYKVVNKKNTYGYFSSTLNVNVPLAKPASIKASAADTGSVTLQWSKVTGAAGYQVQKYDAAGKKWVNVKNVNATSLKVTGLSLGTNYIFRVRAYQTVSNKTVYGYFTSNLTAAPAVPVPTGAKASSTVSTAMNLQWNAVAGATGYEVYRVVDSTLTRVASVKTNSAAIANLVEGGNYCFRIRAYRTVGAKTYYSGYTGNLWCRTAPAKPEVPTVTAYTNNTATIKWNAVRGADQYVLYYYDHAAAKYVWAANTTSLTYTFKGLKPNSAYSFAVKGLHTANGANSLSVLSPVSAKITTFFDVVSPLTAEYGQYSIGLKWDDIANATYDVEKYNYSAKKWDVIRNQEDKRKTDNSHFFSAATNPDFRITNVTTDANSATTITWTAQPSCTKYVVEVSESPTYWQQVATVSGTSAKVYLAPDIKYDIRVIAYNGQYRVRAYKDGNPANGVTAYRALTGVADTRSVQTAYSYAAKPFNPNDNASKTVYALKAVDAINKTKHSIDTSMTVTNKSEFKANVTKLCAVIKLFGKDTEVPLDTAFDFIEPGFLDSLTKEMNYKIDETANFSYGSAKVWRDIEQKDPNTGKIQTVRKEITVYQKDYVAPTEQESVYLYNQNDIANINKKITNMTVTDLGGGKTRISFTLPQEISKNGTLTPVHNGLTDNISDSLSGMMDVLGENMRSDYTTKVGATTISATVNKDGTLDAYSSKSSFDFNMDAFVDNNGRDLHMRMAMKGDTNYNYTFTR